MKINNNDNDFELIVASALRVALRGEEDLSKIVQEFIIDNMEILSEKMKVIFIRDIKERESDKIYGKMWNRECWLEIIKLLQENIKMCQSRANMETSKNINNEINNKNNNFEAIVEAAVRYGLGRRTYITSVIPEFIISNLDILSNDVKFLIIRDIKNQKDYGDNCDRRSWMDLLERLENDMNWGKWYICIDKCLECLF